VRLDIEWLREQERALRARGWRRGQRVEIECRECGKLFRGKPGRRLCSNCYRRRNDRSRRMGRLERMEAGEG